MSGSEYFPVGQTIRDALYYYAVTGLTQSDFTLELSKNGTGGQATTGITITEVSAATNPGIYAVAVSGSTGFVSSVGEYTLKIFRTSDATQYWTFTYRVTADGTGNGTYGAAAWTPLVGNGRITDGAAALENATVRILNAAGTLLYETESDASGLYSTVYLDNGTYSISAARSGYTIATASIVVSSGIATGPGTDVALTAVSVTSTLLASNLWAYAGRMMVDRNGAKATREKADAVDDALESLSLAKQWPFYHTRAAITLNAAYTTGTLAISNGSAVVTFTGATVPTWATLGLIYIDGQSYSIASRDGDAQVTLTVAWNQAALTASSYVLAQHSYTLPADLQRMDQILYDRTWTWGTQYLSNAQLETMRQGLQYGQQRASAFSIANGKLSIWPWPTQALTVNLLYYRRPAKLTAGSDVADWSPLHETVLRRCIDYQASLRGECVAGTTLQTNTAMEAAIDLAFEADQTPVSQTQAYPTYDPTRPFAGSQIL